MCEKEWLTVHQPLATLLISLFMQVSGWISNHYWFALFINFRFVDTCISPPVLWHVGQIFVNGCNVLFRHSSRTWNSICMVTIDDSIQSGHSSRVHFPLREATIDDVWVTFCPAFIFQPLMFCTSPRSKVYIWFGVCETSPFSCLAIQPWEVRFFFIVGVSGAKQWFWLLSGYFRALLLLYLLRQ